ncbi:hypothetical protein J7T55_000567 [Diaporthe amygdali]|uniref:uncharacterized protein n=1 Tax=Phomopsis amygdali TaxID=1214568 RepID=UPI0022FE37A7|nr:uncharacterized protein J7T55_000567 [Diaporthe amygdali]KAJ0110135.1 hypothetical protein J7T55_000567 [Diaporthe amygdali]
MAISGTTSALIAAFAFGIVVNAASASLFLNVRGHGSSIFRDGKRLVLATFLFSTALWAQVGFITTLIDPAAEGSCQIAIVFTTIFDQLARYSIEQHLLWVINDGTQASAGQIIPQGLLGIRFVLGAVFVGLSRPQFNTVCVPVSSVLAFAVTLVVVDGVIVAILAGRAISVGLIKKMQDGGQDSARSKAIIASLIGLTIWMATSVAMLLGISTTDYIFRSTVPAGGLTILLIIVTASMGAFGDQKPRNRDRNVPEAPSPRQIVTARSISTSASNEYPPSRYEDLKAEQINSSTAFVQPRQVPFPNQGLPSIANPGVMGQGVGGVPIQGQLFPPMRAATAPINPPDERQQVKPQNKPKTLFSSNGAGPAKAITVGKLAISAPVLQEGGSNPLDKVATTDLDTAARKERERRALLASQTQGSSAVRNEAAAAAIDPTQGVMRATSTVRKEVVGRASLSALPDSATPATGVTTGSQLSPGGEELRRRSPRHAPSASQASAQSDASSSTSLPPPPPQKSAARALPKNQDVIVKTNIPPSRQLPPSPEPVIPEPAKTPLQRRPTNGLPGNPRAMSVRRPQGESAPQRQQTVMFVNNIIYDDPNLVESVMGDAKQRGPKAAVPPPINTASATSPTTPVIPETPGTSGSIVHRPRPIPRRSNTSGMDTYFPPIAPPKGHRKSKSAGSIRTVKSMLQTVPGSPSNLPPLPSPPTQQIPTYATRPKPNNTKSMTYDEKMTLLFPQPPNAEGSARRRSSVPSLPGMPASFISSSPTLTDNLGYDNQYRESKRTTTSVQTRSLFDEPEEASQRELSMEASRERPNATAYQSLLSETGQDIMADEYPANEKKQSVATTGAGKRASSPVLPARFSVKSASTTNDTTTDDAITEWGTVHSPAPVQQIGLTVHQARAIEVGKVPSQDQRAVSAMTNSEEMIFMLDTSVARDLQPNSKTPSNADEESPVASRASSGQFYRRVGDETLSFSSRPERTRSRRGPPPVPLVLSDRPTTAKQAILVKAAEPSPLPSPEEALLMIQAQLKKYEQPDPGAIESPGQGRLALLNDLEAEMGQQETRWHGMQHDLSRDSFSTVSPTTLSRRASELGATSPAEALSRNSSTKSKESIAADRRASRRARMGSISSTRSSSHERDDSRNRASLWQRRLAEAQMEYMENANELIRKRSLNFLSVAKANANLGSPTPPDSDESEGEIESRRNLAALLEARAKYEAAEMERSTREPQLLWTPRQEPQNESGLMWVRPQRPYEQHLPRQEPPLPGLSVRPAQRKENSTLSIETTQLWQQPTSVNNSGLSGLWKSPAEVQALEQAAQKTPTSRRQAPSYYNPGIQRSRSASGSRPLTQRPPRRSKRITALPDIVEDPQPLPDKRGTLGIFQFPWGEKSDVASVQPRPPLFMAMPGTMSTGGRNVNSALDARARQIESDEYSSSFFDDYDEDRSDSSSDMGSESDDGFDESTLWEIASLLKTDQIPSTNSMFPPPEDATSYMVGEYADEEEADRIARQTILVGIEEPDGLQEMPSPAPPPKSPMRTQSTLWQATRGTEHALSAKGLPQPEDWLNYDAPTETSRAKPRMPVQPALIESDNLWIPSQTETGESKSPMWSLPSSADSSHPVSPKEAMQVSVARGLSSELPGLRELSRAVSKTDSLWKVEEQAQKGEHGVGLPHPDNWHALDNIKSTVRAKPRQSELAAVESSNLWQTSPETGRTKNWLEAPTPIANSKPLWKAEERPKRGEHDAGLPHPDNWEEYDGAKSTIRSKPRQSGPAIIESVNLWQASSVEMPGPRNWLEVPRAMATSSRLWQMTARPKRGDHSVGLPHPESWDSYNEVTTTVRAKPRQAGPATIESFEMWQASSVEKSGPRNWLKLPSQRLWQVTARPKRGDHAVGLPQPQTWEKYDGVKTTVRAKPRQSEPAVIESVDLWQAPSPEVATSPSKMWAPRIQSAPVTRAPSPIVEAFNQAETTKMLWSAPVSPKLLADSGLFNPYASRSDFRTSSQAPAAVEMNRKSRPADRRPVDRLTSTTLWVAEATPQIERNWISPMPSPKSKASRIPAPTMKSAAPARKHYGPIVAASKMDWDAALDQAVAASYPAPSKSSRRTTVQASAADWDAALAEAISKSYRKSFDVSRRHPVFAASSLASKAMVTHPAATGYTYDTAFVHPVFFGSGIFTCPEDNIHPAVARSWSSSHDESIRERDVNQAAIEEEEYYGEQRQMDPALLARIEALEQERQFAEQWARDSFAPVDFNPETPLPPVVTAEERAPQVPEQSFDFQFEPVDVTPGVPLAPLSMSHIAQEPAAAHEGTVLESPAVQRLKRSETFQSVSEMSEAESRVTLRDSLVSVDTPTEMKPAGSRIEFIY